MQAAPTLEQRVAALEAMVRPNEAPEGAPPRRVPRITEIIQACADEWDVPVTRIQSVRQHARYARPRQVAMYLARELTDNSFPILGRVFRRDHSTVIHGHSATAARCARDPDFKARVDALAAALTNPTRQEAPGP